MPEELRFDGRVALVTGAGAGLGRSYALLLGSRGASVVVNDLGGGRHGDGKSTSAADTVVSEIRAAGGKAVANYDSVEDGEKLVKTAIENFGRIDIIINNAGILRDKSFPRISENDWDLIQRVHLKGSFKVTQAAWPYFKKQNFGRVIMTSSNSGIYGNFGQANYSAAKLGLVGLNNTLAIEGAKNNIFCNVIVPTAASRLTEDILPPDLFAELRPELIAPVVVYMCHESCKDNGSVIEAAAGWAGKTHIIRSKGGLLRQRISDNVSLEDVAENWGKVVDMSQAKRLESIGEASGELMSALEKLRGNSSDAQYIQEDELEYEAKDLILYALGVGATVKNEDDLKFLYEGHEDFASLPTLPAVIALNSWMSVGMGLIKIPGKSYDLSNVLHGEEYIEILKPLPINGKVNVKFAEPVVLDKGKGAIALVNIDLFDESGEKVAFLQMTTFLVGCGGFGGPKKSPAEIPTVARPQRAPDASVTQKTSEDQAALYRLSGDRNPLHINPDMAAVMGFASPILHGLSTFGFSARHVLSEYANNDPTLFKSIKVRFTKPVLPGQTLRTDMWREGNRIHFETIVIETNSVAISGAYVDLHQVVPRLERNNVAAIDFNNVSAVDLKSDGAFAEIEKRVGDEPETAKKVNAIFLFNITKDGKVIKKWTLDLKKPAVSSGEVSGVKIDTTFTISDDDFVDLSLGKLNPQVAFMKGKLKITGNIMLAEKMRGIINQKSKL